MKIVKNFIACLTLFAYFLSLPLEASNSREVYRDMLKEEQQWIEMVVRGQNHTGTEAVVEFSDERLERQDAVKVSESLAKLNLKDLKFTQNNNYLELSYAGNTFKIEIDNLDQGTFKINGKNLKVSDQASLEKVAKDLEPLITFETGFSNPIRFFNQIIPSAYAISEKAIGITAVAVVVAAIIYVLVKNNKNKKKKEKQKAEAKQKADKEKSKKESLIAKFRDNLWHYRTGCDMAAHKGAVPEYVFADTACPQKNDKAARSECLRKKGDDCRATYGEKPSHSSGASHI